MLLTHCSRRAAPRADCTAGNSSAINTAMIPITTSSSISVNARRRPLMVGPLLNVGVGKKATGANCQLRKNLGRKWVECLQKEATRRAHDRVAVGRFDGFRGPGLGW